MAERREKENWYFGKADSGLQTYHCEAKSYKDLIHNVLPRRPGGNPLLNWRTINGIDNQGQGQAQAHSDAHPAAPLPAAEHVSTWFPNDPNRVVFYSPNQAKAPMTYAQLQKAIADFVPYNVDNYTSSSHHNQVMVVALLLPSCFMAEMAVTMVTILAQHNQGIALAPIDPNMPHPKIMAALEQLQCSALITTPELYESSLQKEPLVQSQMMGDIRLVTPLVSKDAVSGLMKWKHIKAQPLIPTNFPGVHSFEEKPALLLRTSGTTSTPKVVPLPASALLYNATCLSASLELTSADIGCNVMPLFHIGGIACALLTVLVSGSAVVMVPGPFESNAFVDALTDTTTKPTWYYGVPSMHKAALLTAKARIAANGQRPLQHWLRFIRSGAAHLPHTTAVELAQVFRTDVYPTYSMSECMPVCSSHDAPVRVDPSTGAELPRGDAASANRVPKDTVGVPIGMSMAILDEFDHILPYGTIGEVCLRGPGVLQGYIGLDKSKSHSIEGNWFRTGDMGMLHRNSNGRLVLSGRTKEMIKRGGDQVWPNEVDSVVETVPGVRLAVTFGVPNELWGEEVQVAVVLEDAYQDTDKLVMTNAVGETVEKALGASAKPAQVLFLSSPDKLLKGSTGKYLRTRMADHLGVKAVDTGALQALETMAHAAATSAEAGALASTSRGNKQVTTPKYYAKPSDCLNGVRFLTACFVVQYHIGAMPNNAWVRIQSFTLNMTIFFALTAFELVSATKGEVKSSAATFIGTKIGSMQALFIVAHSLAIISYLLFECGENGYQEVFNDQSCSEDLPKYIPLAIANMFTGLLSAEKLDYSNFPAWFQGSFYILIMIFPLLDYHLRTRTNRYKEIVFLASVAVASFMFIPISFSQNFTFRFISWFPLLLAAMIAGYMFCQYGPTEKDFDNTGGKNLPLLKRPHFWARATDFLSVVFLVFEVLVAISPNCAIMTLEDFEESRPGEAPEEEFIEDDVHYALACDVTNDEYFAYVQPLEFNRYRWSTLFGTLFGVGRFGTPLVLMWIFGLAYGKGWTAAFFNTKPLQLLAPYAYPLYLLHVPVLRFYWIATRGLDAQSWWNLFPYNLAPVEWWELILNIGICVLLGWFLDKYIVKHILPYTIQGYVSLFKFLFRPCNDGSSGSSGTSDSVFEQVAGMVEGLTGNANLSSTSKLRELGLDSLGATALLGTLRASVPAAKTLTMGQLAACDTVGDLVILLDSGDAVMGNDQSMPVAQSFSMEA